MNLLAVVDRLPLVVVCVDNVDNSLGVDVSVVAAVEDDSDVDVPLNVGASVVECFVGLPEVRGLDCVVLECPVDSPVDVDVTVEEECTVTSTQNVSGSSSTNGVESEHVPPTMADTKL